MSVIEQQSVYESDFAALGERSAPTWLRDLRERGMAAFAALGFSTTRHEEWRHTDIRPIAQGAFPLPHEAVDASGVDLDRLGFGGVSAARLVFTDGRFRPDLSRIGPLPEGVRIAPMARALADGDATLRGYLGRYTRVGDDAFDALNTAFIEDGAFIHIAPGVSLAPPIHLLFIASAGESPCASHPRNLIVCESGGHATVVENYVSLAEGSGLTNALTEAVVAPKGGLNHYLLERGSERGFGVSTLHVRQEAQSRFESHTALLGGAIVRNNIHVELTGPGAHSLVNGLYMPRGTQHHDNHMRVVHAAEGCDSRQFYKGVLNDRARGVFTGRIIVRPEGQKTDAKQTNRNLLLSDEAQANARPQLEIYADDVKCTHGATTGQLDDDALHYLRARGIDRETARGLLVYAFAHESLERMTVAPIRKTLERAMIERLPQSRFLRQLL